MLKKGDTCYVRYMGKIEEVKYIGQSLSLKKWHWIIFKSGEVTTVNRFVCMTGIKGKDNG